ncbi:Two-component hybrid sensor and regulator [Rhodovulum sp. PH10]|uniref:PAS domain-containing hybrid sensor histidine kinase/response regulator n=1 Tax=Rhodovulum sp. PH10 TaxID=1187851 RepID=UPI00027C1DD0|nr:PAS domain-containing hybrid sensor histidine kinase/response regulator [Rhodovulum sp. PH10]EJW12907.1 Two-component hybrid sensor and regulator [Rhodovulum sp. PH10]
MARLRDRLDRLARNGVIVVATAAAVVLAVLAYLVFSLRAAQAAGPDVLLAATVATALTAAACGALAPLVRANRALRHEVGRLEERIEALSDAQWELRESEERARSFVEMQGDVVVRRDAEHCVTYVNDAWCTLAGAERGALLGRPFAPPVVETGPVTARPDGIRTFEQAIATPAGPRWIAWREILVRSFGATETQAVGRDVTDRVTAERALAETRERADAASRAKSRFLAMVSHEIRTPLNGILGMTDLLLDTPLSPEQGAYAKAVKTSGRALLTLIEDMLDFAKIEAGKLELVARPFRLAAVVEEVVELLAPRAHDKGIEIAAFVDPRLADPVIGDDARLRQVLLNLGGNAVKFTAEGSVVILAEPGARVGEIALEVRDTGIGIAAEAQARIFEEFEQADGGAARKHGGSGLGLAISRRIVEGMDGAIAVDSAPGDGARFRVTVPLPAAPGLARAPEPTPDLAGTRVAIVTTNPSAAEPVVRHLSAWGASVRVVAPDAADASLVDPAVGTVVVDRAIGPAAAAAIASTTPPAGQRRIVMLRPNERGELTDFLAHGFSDYLVKPVRTASLAGRLGAPAPGTAGPATAPTLVPDPAAAGCRVLVAEDNDINALLVRALLERMGHRPTLVGDGAAAVLAWEAAVSAGMPYALVLMDLHMPGMDGFAATARIRAREAETDRARTPVLALTADAAPEEPDAVRAAGLDGLLVKPLDRDRLSVVIGDVLARVGLAA